MHTLKRTVLALALALLITPAAVGSLVDDVTARTGTTQYAVGFDTMPRDMEVGNAYNGGEVVHVDHILHFIAVETDTPALFEARTMADEDVSYVELDPERQLIQLDPNDEYDDCCQYATTQIDTEGAWDTTLGDTDASVCVVDTGIRHTHEDLSGNFVGGYDFANDDSDPWDDNGHGTHVSGTAAAGLNNALGVAGMGNVALYHAKALNSNGGGTYSDIASAIRWCADNAAGNVVINLSLGGPASTTLENAVEYAHGQGALVVAAAGNDGPCSNCVNYPAAYTEAVAVTCTEEGETQCSFSSDGPEAEIAAPGDRIASTYFRNDGDYVYLDGTSMSSPHVAGVAALVWSEVTSLSRDGLRTVLQDTAQDLGASGWDQLYGYGEIDAGAAMAEATSGGGGGGGGATTVYFEDFTSTSWTKSGGSTDLWRLGSGCLGYTSSSNSLQFNNADTNCDYETGGQSTGWAQSEVIDLSAYDSATLSFQHAWETESYDGGAYDIMRVQASDDGGNSWTTIAQWDSRDDNQLSFAEASFDVSTYTTSQFRVRMDFDTVDGVSNNFQGWHVDDVEIVAS